eukprot:767268-Hanusia_phi.AAC.1
MSADQTERGCQSLPQRLLPLLPRPARQACYVRHGSGGSCYPLVVLSSQLPPAALAIGEGRQLVAGWTDLIGGERPGEVLAEEEEAEVRAEELVGGADQQIAAELADVDERMRSEMNGVDVGEGTVSLC